jgi:hypothetical protein
LAGPLQRFTGYEDDSYKADIAAAKAIQPDIADEFAPNGIKLDKFSLH